MTFNEHDQKYTSKFREENMKKSLGKLILKSTQDFELKMKFLSFHFWIMWLTLTHSEVNTLRKTYQKSQYDLINCCKHQESCRHWSVTSIKPFQLREGLTFFDPFSRCRNPNP